jgi:hypothetical protein
MQAIDTSAGEKMPPYDDQQPALMPLQQALRDALRSFERGDAAGGLEAARRAAALLPTAPTNDELLLSRDGRCAELNGRRIDLSRRASLRRILSALVEAGPATPLTRDAVQQAGWPGERMTPESGAMRVHTAICRLRRLGFGPLLQTRDDGYLLSVRVLRV